MALALEFGVWKQPERRGYRRAPRSPWREAQATDQGPFKAGFAWIGTVSRKIFGGPYLTEANAKRYGERAMHKWMKRTYMRATYGQPLDLSHFVDLEVRQIVVNQYSVNITMSNWDVFQFRSATGYRGFDADTYEDKFETFAEPVRVTSYAKGKMRVSSRHVFKFPATLRLTGLSLG